MSPKKRPTTRKSAKAAGKTKQATSRATKTAGTKSAGTQPAGTKKKVPAKAKAQATTKQRTGKAKTASAKKAAKTKTGVAAKKSKRTPAKKATKKVSSKATPAATRAAGKSSVKKKAAPKKAAAKKAPAKTTTKKAVSKSLKAAKKPENGQKARPKINIEKFRPILLALRARLRGDVNMMSKEALGPDGNSDSRAPLHPAEIGTHSFEQEFTLNLLSSDGDRLEQIEAALEKMTDGSYGACEECGGRILQARLELIPDTPYCVKCASKLEG